MSSLNSTVHTRPSDDTLRLVLSVWEAVLSQPVSPEDDFFGLGGTSLQATVTVVRINQRIGRVLILADLLRHPRARDLAASINRLVAEPRPDVAVTSPVAGRSRVTSDQARRLTVRALDGYVPHERITLAYRVSGPLDATRLAGALDALVLRQEALRTSLSLDAAGQPVARVQESGTPLEVAPGTVVGWPVLVEEFRREGIDRGQHSVFRTLLIRFDSTDWLVAFEFDHLVCDGWSLQIFLEELSALYDGRQLPTLACAFIDHAAAQKAMLESEQGRTLAAFWRRNLAGSSPLAGYRPGAGAKRLWPALPPPSRPGPVPALGAGETRLGLAAAAAGIFLAAATDETDHNVLTMLAHREDPTWAATIGWFASLVPLRLHLPRRASLGELRRLTMDKIVASVEHAELPFASILQHTDPDRYATTDRVATFAIDLTDGTDPDLVLDGVRCAAVDVSRSRPVSEPGIVVFLGNGRLPWAVEVYANAVDYGEGYDAVIHRGFTTAMTLLSTAPQMTVDAAVAAIQDATRCRRSLSGPTEGPAADRPGA